MGLSLLCVSREGVENKKTKNKTEEKKEKKISAIHPIEVEVQANTFKHKVELQANRLNFKHNVELQASS